MSKTLIPISSVLVAITCTALLCILIALAVNLFLFKDLLQSELNHRIEHIVELDEALKPDTTAILGLIRSHHDVDSSSVSYVTPEKAAAYMKSETGLDFLIDETNPFAALVTFQTQAIPNPDLLLLERDLGRQAEVKAQYFQHDIFGMIKSRLSFLSKGVILSSGLFILISFGLLASVYKLILYAERKKIKTMELVGARTGQIVGPYVLKFLGIALMSMVVAGTIMYSMYAYLDNYSPQLVERIPLNQVMFYTAGVWAALLICIAIMSSMIIRRFMRKSIEDLT